jgi:hypothetical protein
MNQVHTGGFFKENQEAGATEKEKNFEYESHKIQD